MLLIASQLTRAIERLMADGRHELAASLYAQKAGEQVPQMNVAASTGR